MGPSPLSGPIQNEGGIPDPLAVPLVWFYTEGGVASRIMGLSPLAGSIQKEGDISDHGPIPPYLKLS